MLQSRKGGKTSAKGLYLDIMLDGRFVGQIELKKGVSDDKAIKQEICKKYPTLRYKTYHVEFSDRRV